VQAAAIRAISCCREAMCGGFWKSKYSHNNTKISRSARQPIRYVFSRLNTYIYSSDKAGAVHVKYVLARRVRTDQRWDADIGDRGDQDGPSLR
jgi:hypothetical protein